MDTMDTMLTKQGMDIANEIKKLRQEVNSVTEKQQQIGKKIAMLTKQGQEMDILIEKMNQMHQKRSKDIHDMVNAFKANEKKDEHVSSAQVNSDYCGSCQTKLLCLDLF